MNKRSFLTLLLVSILAACTPASPSPEATLPADTATPPPLAATSTPLPSLTPTITPTPSPTPSYFVRDGTPVPQPVEAISPENVNQIAELARWGKGTINDIEYSKDGTDLLIWTSLGVRAYDADTFEERWHVEVPAGARAVAYAYDQNVFAIGDRDGLIQMFSLDEGSSVRQWRAHNSEVITLDFSHDLSMLASGHSDELVTVWSLDDLQPIIQFEKHNAIYSKDILEEVFFPADDNTLAIETVNGLIVRSLDSGNVVWSLENSGETFSADLGLAAIVERRKINIYELATGNLKKTLPVIAEREYPSVLAFSPDHSMLAVGYDYTMMVDVWSLDDEEIQYTLSPTTGKETSNNRHARELMISGPGNDRIDTLVFSSDSSILASRNGYARLDMWNMSSGVLTRTLEDVDYSIEFSPDDRSLTTWGGGGVKKLDLPSGSRLSQLQGFIAGNHVEFSPDSKLFRSGSTLWDMQNNREIDRSDWPPFFTFSSDGSSLIRLSHRLVQIYRITDKQLIHEVQLEEPDLDRCGYRCESFLFDFAVSPRADIYAEVLWEGGYMVWGLEDGSWYLPDEFMTTPARYIAFSADGELMAAVSWFEGRVDVYDVDREEKSLELVLPELSTFWEVDFSYDSSVLAAAEGRFVVAWELNNDSKEHILDPEINVRSINTVAVSPTGALVAAGVPGGDIYIWSLENDELVAILKGHFNAINDLAFSPDSNYLASSSGDGTVRLWGIPNP